MGIAGKSVFSTKIRSEKVKGILLAGGKGTRLYPATLAISKQLLPIYDKPMIYYPLSVLMLAGIREILLISQKEFLPLFKNIFGDGRRLGINLQYASQDQPSGIAEALLIGEKFVENDDVALILGDNIFYGQGFSPVLRRALSSNRGATVFAYRVSNPKDFGVVYLNKDRKPELIIEKPKQPKSNLAVTGLYFYTNEVVSVAKTVKPSPRGELEITSVNQEFLRRGLLDVEVLGRGFAWLDTGLPASLLGASQFVETIESRQGVKVACLEEIAFQNGWIGDRELLDAIKDFRQSDYGRYLKSLLV